MNMMIMSFTIKRNLYHVINDHVSVIINDVNYSSPFVLHKKRLVFTKELQNWNFCNCELELELKDFFCGRNA